MVNDNLNQESPISHFESNPSFCVDLWQVALSTWKVFSYHLSFLESSSLCYTVHVLYSTKTQNPMDAWKPCMHLTGCLVATWISSGRGSLSEFVYTAVITRLIVDMNYLRVFTVYWVAAGGGGGGGKDLARYPWIHSVAKGAFQSAAMKALMRGISTVNTSFGAECCEPSAEFCLPQLFMTAAG